MTAFDHWFRLDMEVTGTANGRAHLATGLEGLGWVVTASNENEPRQDRWVVEAGVNGWRVGAALSARLTLNKLARRSPAKVDLRLQEPIVHQEPPRGRYFVQRPIPGPPRLHPLAARTRLFDTGRELFLPPGPDIRDRAESEAVRALPGSALPPVDGEPRPVGTELNHEGRTGAFPISTRATTTVGASVLTSVLMIGLALGDLNPGAAAWAAGLLAVVLGGSLVGAMVVHSPHWTIGPLHRTSVACTIGAAAALVLTAVLALIGSSSPKAWPSALVTACVLFLGNGLRLLLRGLTWQATAAWLIPALLPLILVVLPGFGFSLHALYLDGFGLNREDTQIPAIWQVIADAKALVVAVGPLIAISLLGYARHMHAFQTFGGLSVAAALLFVAFLGAFTLYQSQIIVPASQAADSAKQRARNNLQPLPYFGIAPHRACLRPVSEGGWDGAALVAEHPYLVFPAAGDWASLWDVRTGETLNVKREQYRISDSTAPAC
ncbi:hypothetical protein ACFC6L_16210 [Kitasatospora phosalacinea]|uniref:hypothetical protein n=1 Tax=Kitasatospora phosalacinea TaxID=2065 RepID=UPI0035E0E631